MCTFRVEQHVAADNVQAMLEAFFCDRLAASALLAPAPAPRQTCLAARSGIKTGTIMAEFEPRPFSAGDTVNVACEITEGTTKRIQNYAGVVIKRSGAGLTQTFTVRKMSS